MLGNAVYLTDGAMAMKTQAWSWLVAGVLAAGLNASYHDGGLSWAHQVAEQISYQVEHRSAAVLDLASGHADRFISEARLLTTRQETASCPWSPVLTRIQTRVARIQTRFHHTRFDQARFDQATFDPARFDQATFDQARFDQARFDHLKAISDRQQAQLARFEADRVRLENQIASQIASHIDVQAARLRIATANMTTATFAPVAFKTVSVPVACPRIRVSVPRLPMLRIPAPAIEIESGSGPI